tara:strand:- start:111 stop:338 length:228 start_codon:yes stop_codon:yes gene_type:complete
MANQIDKDSIVESFSFSEEASSYAFIKKEINSADNFSTDIFSVYSSDGTLLAAFDSKEAAIAAIMQSGLRHISLH